MADDAVTPRPATVLDASMLPHIIDSIFIQASSSSLRALGVNKEFRALAHSHMAYHLAIVKPLQGSHSLMDGYEVSSERGDIGRIKYTPETGQLMRASYFRCARVLDIAVELRWSSMVYALVRLCRKAVFRFRCRTDLRGLPFRKATVVLFGEHMPTSVRDFMVYGLGSASGIDTLVMHIRAPGPRMGSLFFNVKKLVLVVHPWMLSLNLLEVLEVMERHGIPNGLTRHERHIAQAEEIFDTQLGVFWDLLWMGFINRIPTTVVGFNFNEPQRLASVDLMRQLYLFLGSDARDAGLLGTAPCPRFLDFDEYRGEVGEETFQSHTNMGWVPRPVNTTVQS